jgi:hypothetical protein
VAAWAAVRLSSASWRLLAGHAALFCTGGALGDAPRPVGRRHVPARTAPMRAAASGAHSRAIQNPVRLYP